MYLPNKSNANLDPAPLSHRHKRGPPIVIGLMVLVLGAFVYIIDRSPGSVYFVPSWFSFWNDYQSFFGTMGNYLPTFAHPFAFILLTSAFIEQKKHKLVLICFTWLLIDSLFELAQMSAIAQWLISILPNFGNIPILENTQNYFRHGTFDLLDIYSIMLGTIAAYFTMSFFYFEHHSLKFLNQKEKLI